jgi:hypothetical protein
VIAKSERHYLRDVIPDLIEKGREAAAIAREATAMDQGFARGRSEAYYEVLSTMIRQLDAFGIERSNVGVPPSLNLEKELL